MTVLLDENVLVALVVDDHGNHSSAETRFLGVTDGFATCPITQGSLIRLLIREGRIAEAARSILRGLAATRAARVLARRHHVRRHPDRRDHRPPPGH